MPGKDTHQKESATQAKRASKQDAESGPEAQRLPLPTQLASLPDQSNARGARQSAALQLQRQVGNQVARQQMATHQIARQEEEEAQAVELADPKSLKLEKELDGHPFGPTIQREEGAAEGVAKKPAAEVALTLKDPDVKRLPEKDIQTKHGKAGIAGYTKPKIDFAVPEIAQYKIKVAVTISFVMDLASEFTDGRLQVLRDHENAHLRIAEKVANEFVVGPLKEELEGLSDYSRANQPKIQTKLGEKLKDFQDNEGTESQAFDDVDYPRMKEAYYGVRTSLADLASGSTKIKTMVDKIDAFNSGANAAAADAKAMSGLVQSLVDAQSALSGDDLARLQYNAEFKTKVSSAQAIVTSLNEKGDSLAEEVKSKLGEASPVLEKFTWQPDIS